MYNKILWVLASATFAFLARYVKIWFLNFQKMTLYRKSSEKCEENTRKILSLRHHLQNRRFLDEMLNKHWATKNQELDEKFLSFQRNSFILSKIVFTILIAALIPKRMKCVLKYWLFHRSQFFHFYFELFNSFLWKKETFYFLWIILSTCLNVFLVFT